MTCPHCAARQERADLLLAAIHGHITDHEFDRRYNMLKLVTNNTHTTMGDIGEDQEEWEVLPTHEPVETPVETPVEQPIPA